MYDRDLISKFEEKALEGDGAFAIALAVMKLADATNEQAAALDRLDHNKGGRDPGSLRLLADAAHKIAEALRKE